MNKSFEDKSPSERVLKDIIAFFNEFGEIMGFDLGAKSDSADEDLSGELLDIIKDIRKKLRQKKEWELSDDIRSQLTDLGIDIEDD